MEKDDAGLGWHETYQISCLLELGNAYSLIECTKVVGFPSFPSLLELLVGTSDIAFPCIKKASDVDIRLKGQVKSPCLHQGAELA